MSIYNIINDLTFTEQEKTKLRSYFFKHSDKVDMAVEILNSCNSSKEKLDFMRDTFLKPEPAGMLDKIFAITIVCDATTKSFFCSLSRACIDVL
jgi:hypothetical protein